MDPITDRIADLFRDYLCLQVSRVANHVPIVLCQRWFGLFFLSSFVCLSFCPLYHAFKVCNWRFVPR